MDHGFSLAPLHAALPPVEPGWVWLVGAGPGDPGLLTLLAAHALSQADAVVHDALVDGRVLGLARPGAEIIHAGKRGGKPSPSQPDISERLVSLAKAGKRVVRLKGGDPFVFGRGAEEARTLVANGVPFRVVPGVTAGVGGLAYAGIPATARDHNAAVTFVTGHAASGTVPDTLDWAALARQPVLVFYMALKHLATIVDNLRGGGLAGETPLAFVTDATTPAQQVHACTLETAVAERDRLGLNPPALVVIGAVVPLGRELAWWQRPAVSLEGAADGSAGVWRSMPGEPSGSMPGEPAGSR